MAAEDKPKKPPTRTAADKETQKAVLERMQRDLDGYVEKYDEIMRAREAQYADLIRPAWRQIRDNLKAEIENLYAKYADKDGKLNATGERKLQRLQALNKNVRETLQALRNDDELLTNSLAYTYTDSVIFHSWGLEQATELSVVVPALTHSAVMGVIANPWLPDGKTYSDRIRANTAYLADKATQAVTRAWTEGWDVQRTAREVMDTAGEGYNNAVRLARTELNRAASMAASHSYMQNADILDGKKWMATLDSRTAPKDAANDGKVYDLDYDTPENPGVAGQRIPNHVQCRCKYSPVVSGVKDRVRERIARDDDGKNYHTQAANYREYAKERGLPDLDERLMKDDPKRYLRNGEDMSAYNGQKGGATGSTGSGGIKTPEKPKKASSAKQGPPADAFAAKVKERIAKGLPSEADVREVGNLVAKELDKALPADIKALTPEYARAGARRRALVKELNDESARAQKGKERTMTDDEYAEKYQEYEEVHAKWLQLRRDIQAAKPSKVREVLARIRSMGKPKDEGLHFVRTGMKNSEIAEQEVDYVVDFLPTDWVTASNKFGPMTAGMEDRGYYQRPYSGNNDIAKIVLSGGSEASARRRVAWHEFGHRMENVQPKIAVLEREFYKRRTEGEALKWLGAGYGKAEKARRDDFLDPYMGKDYSPQSNGNADNYELLSMGLEALYSGSYDLELDKDFRDFILGVLAAL